LSLALHYRACSDLRTALNCLDDFVATLGDRVVVRFGHRVLNITATDAPDKGDALLDFIRDCKASASLVMGDDINDEPAFIKAPSSSVCVRIGAAATPTAARFRLASRALVDPLLDFLLRLHR
jgi:trehalose-6-phosphatase